MQVAEQYVKDTIEVMSVGRSDPTVAGVIDQLRDGFLRGGAEGAARCRMLLSQLAMQMGEERATFIGLTVQTAEAARLWRQFRVVYRVHPGLAESLLDTDTRTTVPCEVFARLPHPDPFVVFPEPIPAPVSEPTAMMREAGLVVAEPPVFIGMLVTGMTVDEQLCSTADPRLHQLSVALAGRIRYEGLPYTHEESTLTVPLTGAYSISDLSDRIANLHTFGKITEQERSRIFNTTLSLLLYLCSDQRDSRTYQPEPGRKGKKRRTDRKSDTVIDLGFDVGPALQAARREAADDPDVQGEPGEGRRVRPHLRRAHWHTYQTGPRTAPIPEVRWLHPILVGKGSTRPVVVDVREPADQIT
ncbi:hypothetical protein [Nocardia neocaledoniensis]|uniref:hypothetical protein n=1 Tax=Nocardia neocaledoniensis TaxID=236511 RepID=UPI002454AC03|nr:hypothetical protein [Nocardia neocaledoniensis]